MSWRHQASAANLASWKKGNQDVSHPCCQNHTPQEIGSSDDDVMPATEHPDYVCPQSESDSSDDSEENASYYKDGEEQEKAGAQR